MKKEEITTKTVNDHESDRIKRIDIAFNGILNDQEREQLQLTAEYYNLDQQKNQIQERMQQITKRISEIGSIILTVNKIKEYSDKDENITH